MIRTLSALATAALLIGAAPALAQDKVVRTIDAVAGKRVRLAVIGALGQDCKIGTMPEVKVATPPKNGQFAILSGKAKPPRCPNLEVPVQGVFYEAKPNFTGSDEVAYELKNAEGKTRIVTFKITVSASEKPGAKPEPKADGLEL